MTEPAGVASPTYLLLLKHDLIAQDITLTITDRYPHAHVLLVRDVATAIRALDAARDIAVALLAMDPEDYTNSELAQMIRSRGGRTILLGDAAEAAKRGADWVALIRPFSTECLLVLLEEGPSE